MSAASEIEPVEELEEELDGPVVLPRPAAMDDEIDITPMIDIVFLLLIFFLVSSKMTGEQYVELPKARHGTVVAAKEAVVLLVKRGAGPQAEVLRADGTAFSSDLEQQAAEVAEYVQQGIDSGKKHVVVRAEGTVRHGEISRLSEAISEAVAEGEFINVAVMEQN